MFYAIDFGTSNTVITRWNAAAERAETIKIKDLSVDTAGNPPLIPSLVYVKDGGRGEVIIGQEVRDKGLDVDRSSRFFRGFKRGIGAKIQGFLPELDDRTITFERLGEWFLNTIIDNVKNEFETPKSLVLTVPVDSFESYRVWLSEVCQDWGIEQVRLLDEPTAVALGYSVSRDSTLLIVDFGGGTLDLSLVRLNIEEQKNQGFILKWGDKLLGTKKAQKSKLARVLGKVGTNLGGSDIDEWIFEYFQNTVSLPRNSLTARLVEKLKINLSSLTTATETYFDDGNFESYELNLDREIFREILNRHDFFKRLDDLMTEVLQQGRRNGIEVRDIDAVLAVGGTVQIPAVKDWLRKYFEADKIKGDRPFEAVASGALQLARGFEVRDFLYHGYGVRYWDRRQNRHNWHTIIKAGQPYPMTEPVELVLGASVDNQPSIELIIGELGAESGGTEVYFDGDRLVTRSLEGTGAVQPLNDSEGGKTIATLTPPGVPGNDRVRVQFRVDERGFLLINVEDILTGETLLSDRAVVRLS